MTNKQVHLVIAYKNFAIYTGVSHIGLGIAALSTAKALKKCGVKTTVLAMREPADLPKFLQSNPSVTHCVVSAPWIPSAFLQNILASFPDIEFSVNCHSNVGFLQADTDGVRLLREAIDIEKGTQNFRVAGNSKKFARWVHEGYSAPCIYLPNIYYLDHVANRAHRPSYSGGVLRIGAFGAIRAQKNFMSAAGAVLEIANHLKVETEFYINGGRNEGGNGVANSIHALIDGLPGIKIVPFTWSSWPDFLRTVRTMHLMLQVSYTESFNIVTADGVAEGVPSVVSDAIEWAPESWQARIDDVNDIARVGERLLYDVRAPHEGLVHLERYNTDAIKAWAKFLGLPDIQHKPLVHDIDTHF